MSARTWLYSRLKTLSSHEVGQRVFAKKSMTSANEVYPFLVYKFGQNSSEGFSESIEPTRQFLQIFVHDYADAHSGDYLRIDDVLAELKRTLGNQSSAGDGVITARYLETSQDLNDETLNTVMKYIRFQLILLEE